MGDTRVGQEAPVYCGPEWRSKEPEGRGPGESPVPWPGQEQ